MAERGKRKDVDAEVDYHGCTVEEMHIALQKHWHAWRGMTRVRIITGQGVALKPALDRWCRELGVPWQTEPSNPGSTLIFPRRRGQNALPQSELSHSLADKGLRLTPEQEAEFRDPEAARKARIEAQRTQEEQARLRKAAEAVRMAQKRQEDSMWQQEIARLDGLEKKRTGKNPHDHEKPSAPVVIRPAVLKFQEGYWRGELARVADTDHEQLKVEKKTGLEKLAPPIEPAKPGPAPKKGNNRPKGPVRDEAADRALFEEELRRLSE